MAAKKRQKRRAPRYSEEKIIEGFAAWLSTGSSTDAAKKTKILAATIRQQRKRRPELWQRVVADHERKLSDLRSCIAENTAEALKVGSARCRELLKDPELSPKDVAALVRAVSDIDGTQDKIRRLDSLRPTEIIEERSDADAVAALKRELEALGISAPADLESLLE